MDIFSNHPHWDKVMEVCKRLATRGFQAWLAGGCVRDMIMNVTPKDFDVATNAKPDEVQKLFPDSLDIGKQFGIIMIPFENFQVEVATFRSDGEYTDGRHPATVVFSNPEEDAKRRDFTVNALFYDPFEKKIYDYVDGQKDIKVKTLKAVGQPKKRFQEDKLRILRAIRFSAQLDFEIESNTLSAINEYSSEIHQVSKERIYQELKKLFESKALNKGLEYLFNSRLALELFKDLSDQPNHFYKNNLEAFEKVAFSKSYELRWAVFIFLFYKEKKDLSQILSFLDKYKFPKDFSKKIQILFDRLKWVDRIEKKPLGERIVVSHAPESDVFIDFFKTLVSLNFLSKEKLSLFIEARKTYIKLPLPLLNGHDLMTLGVNPGQIMGEMLQKIYHYQLENRIEDKEILVELFKNKKFNS